MQPGLGAGAGQQKGRKKPGQAQHLRTGRGVSAERDQGYPYSVGI